MKQEVQIILTLEVDTDKSESDIRNFMMEIIRTHSFHSSTYNRMCYNMLLDFKIKEEAEIYNLEKKTV